MDAIELLERFVREYDAWVHDHGAGYCGLIEIAGDLRADYEAVRNPTSEQEISDDLHS